MDNLNCELPKPLKSYLAKDKKNQLYGCFTILWEHQANDQSYSKAILLNADGKLQTRSSEGNQAIKIEIPPEAVGQKLLFRLSLFPIERFKQFTNNISDHQAQCTLMGRSEYNCLYSKSEESCEYIFQLQATSDDSSYMIMQIGKKKETKNCKICSLEICGDKIDNNCNGLIDEFNEKDNQPCPQTQP